MKHKTKRQSNFFSIIEEDIIPTIKNLDADKSYIWDNISIRMIKLYGKTIAIPLKLMFK